MFINLVQKEEARFDGFNPVSTVHLQDNVVYICSVVKCLLIRASCLVLAVDRNMSCPRPYRT